jgi:hypothetical protein
MCCCGKPTINGELGYRWNQPDAAPSVYPVNPPDLQEGDVLLFDEPGRCGGLDSHSRHFRLVKHECGTVSLLVRHGGGDERIRLYPHRDLPKILEAIDSTSRYWMLATIHSAHRDGETNGRDGEYAKWQTAAAEKRIRTRKFPARGVVKVWIEAKRERVEGPEQAASQ